nr:MAG TPA: hypothetical protein [Caudoviricetes sp.]
MGGQFVVTVHLCIRTISVPYLVSVYLRVGL